MVLNILTNYKKLISSAQKNMYLFMDLNETTDGDNTDVVHRKHIQHRATNRATYSGIKL